MIVIPETSNAPEALGFIFEQPSAIGDHVGQQQSLPDETWVNCNKRTVESHVYNHSSRLHPLPEIA
jgi:hypothetical protein